jgi:hypothetical protein
MNIWEFLVSPTGQEVTHAVVVLILAIAAYFTYLAHQYAKANTEKLDDHISQHVVDAFTTGSRSDPPTHNI